MAWAGGPVPRLAAYHFDHDIQARTIPPQATNIAKLTERHEFPDRKRVEQSYTHNLEQLLKCAELKDALDEAMKDPPKVNANWVTVTRWSARSRYEKGSKAEAEELLKALRDPKQRMNSKTVA